MKKYRIDSPLMGIGVISAYRAARTLHRSQNPDMATRRRHAQIVKLEWKSGDPAFRTSIENPTAQAIVKTVGQAYGSPVIQAVGMGGTVQMYLLSSYRHVPVLGVPIANHDDNQHAADENLRLRNLWDAIEVYAAILATVGNDGTAWPNGR